MKVLMFCLGLLVATATVVAQPPPPPPLNAPLNKSFLIYPDEPLHTFKGPWPVTVKGDYQKTGCVWLPGSVTVTIKDTATNLVVYAKTATANTATGTWNGSSGFVSLPVGTYFLEVHDDANGVRIHRSTLYIIP